MNKENKGLEIGAEYFEFLNQLTENNHREWFQEHKKEFDALNGNLKKLHAELMQLMNEHDVIEGGRVYRIYRDVRFSKDKTPYKNYFAGSFKRAGAERRGGYYFQIEPGKSFVAGGFWGPNAADLKHLRQHMSQEPELLQSVLHSSDFKQFFGKLEGDSLKKAPKGFEADDPAIDLLRMKQYLVFRYFTDEEVTQEGFMHEINDTFKAMRPFFDVMSEWLTTDHNGVSLL